MKKIYLIIAFSLISLICIRAFGFQKKSKNDTNEVIRLNDEAFKVRKEKSERAVFLTDQAIDLSRKLGYENGLAEAYRVRGIWQNYNSKFDSAYSSYREALKYFEIVDNKLGAAKVKMNLGNFFREDNYPKALSYYETALPVALQSKDSTLIASLMLNMGTVYFRQKKYTEALSNFTNAQKIYEKQDYKSNIENIISCIQNVGQIYYMLNDYTKATELLLKAKEEAKKQKGMEATVASIGIPLTEISIAIGDFEEAEKYIKDGLVYALNKKTVHDYNYLEYQLEMKRKRYEKAVDILAKIYRVDSTDTEDYLTQQIDIADANTKLKENELTIAKQKNTQSIAIGIGAAAILLTVVVILLVLNVKRKAETNKQLTDLNGEVSRQKENVDRINRHLEEIIDERTKDLQIKNKKLAEHSSYLSHQIRGPIATLKGLMNLEKEGLVEQQECINMMNKCVSEIDDKIIDMSDMLHNPGRTGL